MPTKLASKRNSASQAHQPVSALLDYLNQLSLDDLRQSWRAAHPGVALPHRLSCDLMVRAIAWQVQCLRCGGLGPASERLLEKMARQLEISGTLEIERSVRPKTGTKIIREWRGRTYVVEAAGDGFVHDGSTFASLSHVARAITGTRWSGPRFFGLKHTNSVACGEGEG